ncbi:hypothetical protein NEOLEDRAFT_1138121 [Neolentinus lepideus HHB14362 ss-1]|uniref:Uncharacterized protein n=1 Tax=Neolentinus lepideus HHB14362 ss-1 TaxID=1314782 RepID=A0A165QH31_9AGAM|nr:hypothetical protein NEOLEDRAFT_1138121 [Neolentinus lepideus HHB14362 ss-1]
MKAFLHASLLLAFAVLSLAAPKPELAPERMALGVCLIILIIYGTYQIFCPPCLRATSCLGERQP